MYEASLLTKYSYFSYALGRQLKNYIECFISKSKLDELENSKYHNQKVTNICNSIYGRGKILLHLYVLAGQIKIQFKLESFAKIITNTTYTTDKYKHNLKYIISSSK